MVKKDTHRINWICQIEGCIARPKDIAAIGKHVSKRRQERALHFTQSAAMPVLCKKYTYLEQMLIHLQLKTGKQTWQSCECPLNPTQYTDHQIWKMLLTHNKQTMQEVQTQQQVPTENRVKNQPKTKLPHKQTMRQPRTTQHRKTTWEILGMAEKQQDHTWMCTRPECTKPYKTAATITKHIYATHAKNLPHNPKKPQPCPYCRIEQENIHKLLEHLTLQSTRQHEQCKQIEGVEKQKLISSVVQKHQPREKKHKRNIE